MTLFALAYDRVPPALLSFTPGGRDSGRRRNLPTSRPSWCLALFRRGGQAGGGDRGPGGGAAWIVYLEDMRKQITSLDKALGALASLAPGLALRQHEARAG